MVNVVLLSLSVSNITLLADLEAFFHSSKRPFPLLVRILHRSRIRYYGKAGQNIDFPFQVSWGHGLFSLMDIIIYLLLQWWSDTTLCLIYLSGVLWGGWSEWHCVNGLMEWTLPRMVPSANSWLGSVLTAVCCKTQLSETLKAAHQHSLTHGIPLHWYELDLN